MPLQIIKSALRSRAVRSEIGIRKIEPGVLSRGTGLGELGSHIVNGLGKLLGFIVSSVINVASWGLTEIWSLIVQASTFVWNFNWNISDKDLDRQIKGQWDSFGSLLGGLAGNAFGWFSCGILPGASIFAFNRALGLYVLKEVGEEALEELAGNLSNVVRQSIRNVASQTFAWVFKNWRNWMKQPNNVFAKALFGDRYKDVMKEWGKSGGPVWSFAKKVEDKVESISDPFWRNFVEEFLEEAWDGCVEAGFVVANSVESYLAMQKQSKNLILGPERLIEITPDREAEEEKIILSGPEELIKTQLPQTLATHQLLDNRDVGQIVGQPADDEARGAELTLRLKIILYNSPAPPWRGRRVDRPTQVTITIPDVRRTALDWEKIRYACGGQNGYLWGRFKAVAWLTNRRSLTVYGASASEAEQRLKLFAALSEAQIKTINITEETKEGDRLLNPGLYKEVTRVYPAYCFVMNRELVLAGDKGRPVGKQRYRDKRYRLNLWQSTKPYDWEEKIAEVLRKSN